MANTTGFDLPPEAQIIAALKQVEADRKSEDGARE
jgi:hypothetical protein